MLEQAGREGERRHTLCSQPPLVHVIGCGEWERKEANFTR